MRKTMTETQAKNSKEERHQLLRSLISAQQIGTQSELAKLLKKEGHRVTQYSVSRDLEELGVIKAHGFYSLPLSLGQAKQLKAAHTSMQPRPLH